MTLADPPDLRRRLRLAFGAEAGCEGPLAGSGAGIRLTGLDLGQPLSAEQVTVLLDALSRYRIVTIPGQDLAAFSLAHFERFANHWGAPVPHPSNFTRGGKSAQSDGASDGAIEMLPSPKRTATGVNAAFPERLRCLPHTSPTVLVVANFRGGAGAPRITGGGSWHTDIEYERLPIYVSMFLVHQMPVRRETPASTWVQASRRHPYFEDRDGQRRNESPPWVQASRRHPYFEGSGAKLMRRRVKLPLNGETAYADTAAAFAALPPDRQRRLSKLRVRRRLNEGDPGWLAPLVRTNPRSGIKSLHSPIWASRPRVRPPITVDGMSRSKSREFLDELETTVLDRRFRYDHPHCPGDLTIWDNTMTLHNSPPMKVDVDDVGDARLLYRLSCKGGPALTLPRQDTTEWLKEHVPGGYRTPDAIIEDTPL